MRSMTWCVTAAMVFLFAVWPAEAAVFRNLSWGDPPAALGDIIVVETNGPLLTVERRQEDRQLGSVTALVIRYSFFERQLYQVSVGTLNGAELERLVFARYGQPTTSLSGYHFWDIGDEDTLVTFVREDDLAVMILSSMSLLELVDMWERSQEEAEARSAW